MESPYPGGVRGGGSELGERRAQGRIRNPWARVNYKTRQRESGLGGTGESG